MTVAGVMSGSSLDGLDIAIVHFEKEDQWQLLWSAAVPYSTDWVQRLRSYTQLSAIDYIRFKSEYSYYIGKLLRKAFSEYQGKIDYVSFHGHTIIHLPNEGITEQIGNGGIIAAMLNLATLTDFRVQDVARGGVGTPLAPLVEITLFKGHQYYLNLGGIANLSIMNADGHVIAYDVCPCNQVLNHYSQLKGKDFDSGGEMARNGSLDRSLLAFLDSIPYLAQEPPKSLDNNWIVESFIPRFPHCNAEDALHTYTHWMAKSIAHEVGYGDAPSSLMSTGGGTHNTYFMQVLEEQLADKNCSLYIPDTDLIDYKEAMLMALLAKNYLENRSNVLSSVTGASSDTIGGALYKIPQ